MQPVNERKINKTLSAPNYIRSNATNVSELFMSVCVCSFCCNFIHISSLFVINTTCTHRIIDILRCYLVCILKNKIIGIDFLLNIGQKWISILWMVKRAKWILPYESDRIFEFASTWIFTLIRLHTLMLWYFVHSNDSQLLALLGCTSGRAPFCQYIHRELSMLYFGIERQFRSHIFIVCNEVCIAHVCVCVCARNCACVYVRANK